MKSTNILIGAAVLVIIIFVVVSIINKSKKEGSIVPNQNSTNTLGEKSKKFDRFPGVLSAEELNNKTATIKTAKGEIKIELLGTVAPKAVSNFIFLSKKSFYDGLTFHRREGGFVIQGGDPNGNGTGGPGYEFEDEPVTLNYDRGIVAMANSGPNTNGSQFFIMLANNDLPKKYTIFGKVISGMDVVDKIKVGDVMEKVEIN
jgi:cyclophilin family peptidyl-prolyl cis-trans isomerase